MKREPLLRVSVETSLEAEEPVAELLGRIFCQTAAVYSNEKTKISTASVYCQKRSVWTPKERADIKEGLRLLEGDGLQTGPGRIIAKRVPREDWSESWKKHFKPIAIGSRLLVKPSWIRRKARKNQAVVVLDPGLSFGTGNHPTTGFCLWELVRCRKQNERQSFLDIGTGTGILAIAAAKLGYRPVVAFDFDPEAVHVAQENAGKNKVTKLLSITRKDVTKLPKSSGVKYDVICANLISDLLMAEKERILARLKPGGTLVLAGILKSEFVEVQRAFENTGMKLVRTKVEKEWRSGAFSSTSL